MEVRNDVKKTKKSLWQLCKFETIQLIRLQKDGFSVGDIVETVGRNISSVYDCSQQSSREGTASRKSGSGRWPHGTTQREESTVSAWMWRIFLRLQQKIELQFAVQ